MIIISDEFKQGKCAIRVPEPVFDEFISACIDANIRGSYTKGAYDFAYSQFQKGKEVFAFVAADGTLDMWTYEQEEIEYFKRLYPFIPLIHWSDAIRIGRIIWLDDLNDIMEFLI